MLKPKWAFTLLCGWLFVPLAIITFDHNPLVSIIFIAMAVWCHGVALISLLRK